MYCEKCGYSLKENSKFCENCGNPVAESNETKVPEASQPQQNQPNVEQQPITPAWQPEQYTGQPQFSQGGTNIGGIKPNSGLKVWAIILIVASVVCCGGLISLVLAIIAVVMCSQAANATNPIELASKEKTAKILCIISTVFVALNILIFIITFFATMANPYIIEEIFDGYNYY